ncbi:hypothetical protein C4571_03640 [Candidatus Parcubacteria bacterium]|nr:MAG: hypothetical protein C4571_03640 [Candidatus Parcubacteria bacterium]
MISVSKAFAGLFSGLSSRQREVISGRFGLEKGKEPETLAGIGKRLGVTRERVRQIEKSGLNLIRKELTASPSANEILNRGKKYLKENGGVVRQDVLLEELEALAEGLTENHLALFLEASKAFNFQVGDKNFWPFYHLGKSELKTAVNFVDSWASFLDKQKTHVLSGKYEEQLRNFIRSKNIPTGHAEAYLNISKRIHKNPFGDIGLREWAEIRPMTIRDRIYLVLKKKGEPLHFETIAKNINGVGFDKRIALASTVHNELIKDDRFVLVGRGMYGLREQGYEPGTAKVVIKRVLQKNGPLKPQEVVAHVQRERFFKPNTVLINLQDKSSFKRLTDGRYHIREA